MAGTNVCMDCIRSEYRDDTVQKNINAGLELPSPMYYSHIETQKGYWHETISISLLLLR